MKSARHQAILDLIEKYPIDRQEDLLEHLRRAGFDVTQATVSRDIRELRLVKTATGEGGYRYMPANGNGKVAHLFIGISIDLVSVNIVYPQFFVKQYASAGTTFAINKVNPGFAQVGPVLDALGISF